MPSALRSMICCMVGRIGCVALAAVALAAGCSGGSSSPSSGRRAGGRRVRRRRPTSTATRHPRRWPPATRGRWPLATWTPLTAWPIRGTGRPPTRLTRLEQRVKAIPIAAAQVKPGYRTGMTQYGRDFATVPVTIRVKLSHAAPTEWVLLGKRDLLMHRSDGGWKVVGDVTAPKRRRLRRNVPVHPPDAAHRDRAPPSSMDPGSRGTRRGRSSRRWMHRRPGSRRATAARSQRSARWRSS